MPSRCRIVAWKSWTWTGSSTTLIAEVVGLAVGDARLDAAAGHPEREGVGVVVAAPAACGRRCCPAGTACGRTRRPRSPACRRAGRAASGPCTSAADGWSVSRHWMLSCGRQVAVLVPAGVHELDEAHAALDQAAGHQAVVGEACPARCTSGPYMSRTCLRLAARSRSAPARSPASGRPSRTGRCAWRSPGRRTRAACISFSLREVVEQAAAHRRGSCRRGCDR